MKAGFRRCLAALALACLCSAHVGSPDTWWEGMAGPYPIRVVLRSPGVVPALADVAVRVLDPGLGVQRVTVSPAIWNSGPGGAPPPEVARRVPGDTTLFTTQLWFMATGTYRVAVAVTGARGEGSATVPFQATATRRLEMGRSLGIALVLLGGFLVIGLLSIFGAAAREAVLPPGERPDRRHRWRGRGASIVGSLVLALALLGGRGWWNSEDTRYRNRIYRPFGMAADLIAGGSRTHLRLQIQDSVWRSKAWTPLIPDHGKLMHLFLVRDSGFDVFAHLHPELVDSTTFDTRLPPLPAGRYRIFGDIVQESGFAQTLVTSIRLEGPGERSPARSGLDPDDSWTRDTAVTGRVAALADGSTMTWDRGDQPLTPGNEAPLQFTIRAPDGGAVPLEPYLGMSGHAILLRSDGEVFIHLHPGGTPPTASALALTLRRPGDSLPGTLAHRLRSAAQPAMGLMPGESPGVVRFPYAFPAPGRYYLWIQIRRAGRILTGSFLTEVH